MHEDEEKIKAEYAPEEAIIATSSRSTNNQLDVDIGKLKDNEKTEAEAAPQQNAPAEAAEKKPNWFTVWFIDPIRTQIKTFNPMLLILGIK